MKPVFLFTSFFLAALLSINGSLADTVQPETGSIPVYVDGKLVSSIKTEQFTNALNLGQHKIENIPPQNHWYSVVIKNTKGTTLSFQDWQRNYQGKAIILSAQNNKKLGGLYYMGNSKPLYLIDDIEGIFIETRLPTMTTHNNQPLPDLYITTGKKATLIEYRHLGESGQYGWQLEHILNAVQRGSSDNKIPISRFELDCNNGAEKISLSRPFAEFTFLKVNQKNQWRAIVIDSTSKSKRNWKKCHQLSKVSIY